jgi:hypothetical protein
MIQFYKLETKFLSIEIPSSCIWTKYQTKHNPKKFKLNLTTWMLEIK